jgi:DNA-binding XRE family transcriptional regulator
MSAKGHARKVELTPQQRAEHRRIRKLFQDWHPSPEELIASGEGEHFDLHGEYPYLRPFLAELKQTREQQGLSLADVARRCGVDKAALSRLENGHNPNPTLDTLWRYAAALGRRLLLDSAVITPTTAPGAARPRVPRTKAKHVGRT